MKNLHTNPRPLHSEGLSKRNNYTDTFDENLEYITTTYPGKILFDLKEVANILSMSYEYIRISVNNEIIYAKQIGSRRLVHRGELARMITEGVNNNGSKKK
jgi:hypothetical protein